MDPQAAARAARRLRAAGGARYAALFRREQGAVRLAASAGAVPSRLRAARRPLDLPASRHALREGRAVVGYAVVPGLRNGAGQAALRDAAAALRTPGRDAALDAVAEVSARLAGEVELGAILRTVVDRVRALVPASCVYVALWDRDTDMIHFPYYYEGTRRDHAPDRPFADGLTEYVLRTAKTLHIRRDFAQATRRRRIRWRGTASRSWLGIPLRRGKEAVGVLAVYDNERDEAFTDRHERIVTALAAQAAAALRNADLLAAAERRRERLREHREALRALTREALRAPDLPGALAEIVVRAAATLHVQRVGVWLFDEAHDRIRCVELYEADPGRHTSGLELAARDYPAYFAALETERTLDAHDARADPRTREFSSGYLVPHGITSMLDAPIRAGGRLIGVACHEHVGPAREWTPEEQAFAASVADLAALAIERSERERAEAALRTQTAMHTSLLQAQSDLGEGFLVLDPVELRILHVNEALLRISGRTRDELTSGSFLQLASPANREMLAERNRARLSGAGAPERYELPAQRGDGTPIDLEVAVKTVQTPEGPRVIALVRDITARKATDRELRHQKTLYETLLRAQSDVGEAFLVLDPLSRTVLYANDAVERISGYSVADLTAEGFFERLPEETQDLFMERLSRRLAGEKVEDRFEVVLRHRDGRRLVVEIASQPFWEGEDLRLVFVARDVTARHEAEAELRRLTGNLERLVEERTRDLERTKRNLETVFANTGDGFLFVDENLRLVSANQRFADFFGMTAEEILGSDPGAVRERGRARYRDPAKFDEAARVYEPDRRHLPFSSVVELVDGRVLHEESVAIFDRGRYAGRVWTYHDITDRKRLEEELMRYAQTLEAEVDKRTGKLLQSAKMAALGQLVAGVAHEINNPLAFVKSNTSTVLEEVHDLQAAAALREAAAGRRTWEEAMGWLRESPHWSFLTEDLERLLVANLRGLTRISDIVLRLRAVASPQAPRKEPTDLTALVRDTTAIFTGQFSPRVRLEEEYGPVPPVVCDAGQMAQVVVNLLVNAGQAIAERGVVRVALRREDGEAVLTVRDDGAGMDAATRARIFDPFFTTKDMGTGLGLSISYTIVKEHGGDISVESEPGKGTTMTVRIPIHG